MTHVFDLVVFDCDGVLVDSEHLANHICARLITDAGFPISIDTLNRRYAGMVFLDILKDIEKNENFVFSSRLLEEANAAFTKEMSSEALTIVGIEPVLQHLKVPYCVCSNGTTQNVEATLTCVGLWPYFKGKIFSAQEVGTKRLKPAPDVFLYAAKHYNVAPEKCLVLEDSVPGVAAAHAAGMKAIGFTGGRHTYLGHADALMEAGAITVIKKFSDFLPTMQALEQWDTERFL